MSLRKIHIALAVTVLALAGAAALNGASAEGNLRIVTIIEIDSLPNLITNAAPKAKVTTQPATSSGSSGSRINSLKAPAPTLRKK